MKKGLIYFFIFGVWLFLRIHYFVGYYDEDAPGYNVDAMHFAVGLWRPLSFINGQNIATYLPVGFFYYLFGKSEWVLSIWPLLSSFLGGFALGVSVQKCFGFIESVVVLLLYSFYPGLILFSTLIMPDGIQTSWLAVSASFLLFGVFNKKRRVLFYFLSGICLGISYLVRANTIILIPIYLLVPLFYVFYFKQKKEELKIAIHQSLVIFIGFLLMFSIEGILNGIYFGNILHRIFEIKRHYGAANSSSYWGLTTDLFLMPSSLIPLLDWVRLKNIFSFNMNQSLHGAFYLIFSPIYLLMVGWLFFGFLKKNLRGKSQFFILVSMLIFGFLVLYHEFGSQDCQTYRPIHRLSRHFFVFLPWALMSIAGFIYHFRRKFKKSWGLFFGCACLIFYCVEGTIAARIYQEDRVQVQKIFELKVIHAMKKIKKSVIYIDSGSGHLAGFYVNELGKPPNIRVRDIFRVKSCKDINEGYVLLNTTPAWANRGKKTPLVEALFKRLSCLSHPPKNWKKLEFEDPIEGYRILAN